MIRADTRPRPTRPRPRLVLTIVAPRGGDIGDTPREYEFEPLTAPAVEPVTTPAPAPTPEPVKEPAHV